MGSSQAPFVRIACSLAVYMSAQAACMLVQAAYKQGPAVCRQQTVAERMYRPEHSQHRQVQDYRPAPGYRRVRQQQVRRSVCSQQVSQARQAHKPDHSYGHSHNHIHYHSGFAHWPLKSGQQHQLWRSIQPGKVLSCSYEPPILIHLTQVVQSLDHIQVNGQLPH